MARAHWVLVLAKDHTHPKTRNIMISPLQNLEPRKSLVEICLGTNTSLSTCRKCRHKLHPSRPKAARVQGCTPGTTQRPTPHERLGRNLFLTCSRDPPNGWFPFVFPFKLSPSKRAIPNCSEHPRGAYLKLTPRRAYLKLRQNSLEQIDEQARLAHQKKKTNLLWSLLPTRLGAQAPGLCSSKGFICAPAHLCRWVE